MLDETARQELDDAIRDFGQAWGAWGRRGALSGMLSPSYTPHHCPRKESGPRRVAGIRSRTPGCDHRNRLR